MRYILSFTPIPQITAGAPQCQVLYMAQTRTRQGFLSFQPREKKQPPPVSPPVPTRPVNPPPIMIICCCTCRGLYVSRDTKVRGLLRAMTSDCLGVGGFNSKEQAVNLLCLRTTTCRPALILGKEGMQESMHVPTASRLWDSDNCLIWPVPGIPGPFS